jgi:uncharacterized protein YjbI with pentapeptide repeats
MQLWTWNEERKARAWQLLAIDSPGNTGKIFALEYLNSKVLWGMVKKREGLTGIRLPPDSYLRGVNLEGANLFEAQLKGADLSNAQLQGANLQNSQLQGANLEGALLEHADLSGATLQGTNLARAQLPGADLRGMVLNNIDLSWANLGAANLALCQLQGSMLYGAQLQDASLFLGSLQEADLESANLRGASLTWADLKGARLWQTNLQGTNFTGANLEWVDFTGTDRVLVQTDWGDGAEYRVFYGSLEKGGYGWRAYSVRSGWPSTDLSFANFEGVNNLDTAELAGAEYWFADGLEGTILDINQPPPDVVPAP